MRTTTTVLLLGAMLSTPLALANPPLIADVNDLVNETSFEAPLFNDWLDDVAPVAEPQTETPVSGILQQYPQLLDPGFLAAADAEYAQLAPAANPLCALSIDALCEGISVTAATAANYDKCNKLLSTTTNTVCISAFVSTANVAGSFCGGITAGNVCQRDTTQSQGMGLLDLQLEDDHISSHTSAICRIIGGVTANNPSECTPCGPPSIYAVCGVKPTTKHVEHVPADACVFLQVDVTSGLWGQLSSPTLEAGSAC